MTDNTMGDGMPKEAKEIQKSVFVTNGAIQEMSRQDFKEGDEVRLAVFEEGSHEMRGMVIVRAGRRATTFVYQVKPRDGGEKAGLYKDEKGNDWFEEEDLVLAPKK